MSISLRLQSALCAAAVLGCSAPAALAGFTDLGGGWRAEWDATLDPFVNITSFGVMSTPNGDAVFIRKEAEFTQASVNGQFPSIQVNFRQADANAVGYIVIDDEIVTNSTGEDWYDFHMQLLDSGEANFDAALTASSGGPGPIGWDINPFSQANFATTTDLDLAHGIIPNMGVWTPGAGMNGGDLWIDVTPHSMMPYALFTLKETPSLPEPGSIAMMTAAAICGFRSRRRRMY